MTKNEMIGRVRRALLTLEGLPDDVTVLTLNIAEYTNNYIQTHDCIQRIADAFGTITTRRVNIDSNYAKDVITLDGELEVLEVCDPMPEEKL